MFSWNAKAPGTSNFSLSEPIVLVVATFMLLVGSIFHGLAFTSDSSDFGFDLNLGEFWNSTVNNSNGLQIAPPIWGYATAVAVVYLWQVAWIVYGWTFLFRQRVPKTIPMASYLFFAAAMVFAVVRLYMYANGHVNPGIVCQILATLLALAALVTEHFLMYHRTSRLREEGWIYDKWLTRAFVQNGLALLVTWEIIQLLLYMAVTMQNNSGKTVTKDVASSIAIILYVVFITVWFLLETSILDQFMRYTVTIYPLCLWLLMSMIVEQWDHKRFNQPRNNNLLTGALSYTAIIQICRFLFLIFFRFTRPLEWPHPAPNRGGYDRIQFQY